MKTTEPPHVLIQPFRHVMKHLNNSYMIQYHSLYITSRSRDIFRLLKLYTSSFKGETQEAFSSQGWPRGPFAFCKGTSTTLARWHVWFTNAGCAVLDVTRGMNGLRHRADRFNTDRSTLRYEALSMHCPRAYKGWNKRWTAMLMAYYSANLIQLYSPKPVYHFVCPLLALITA